MGLFNSVLSNVTSPEVAGCDKQMAALEERRRAIIFEIGSMYVASNSSANAAGTVYENQLKEIEQIADEVIVLEKRKLALQGLRKCDDCGHVFELDSAFCSKCGKKLEVLELANIPVAGQNKCPKCGANHEKGAMFCMSCGNKLG